MKVMLDTNIIISAAIFKSKTMQKVIQIISDKHTLILCSYVVDEFLYVVKEKFKDKLIDAYIFLIFNSFEFVQSPLLIDTSLFDIRDKDDYIILYTAVIRDIDVFITGDKDFQNINLFKPEILTPSEFLQKYS